MRTLVPVLCIALTACGGGGGDDGGGGGGGSSARFYPGSATVPVTGPDVPDAARIDQILTRILKDNDVPGATLAIAVNGRLVFARGYGYADFESQQQMQPDSMFRIGSVSKALTSIAVLHLKDQLLLDIDQKYLGIMTEFQVPPNGDARINDISIRNLLQHAGGWIHSQSPDPSEQEILRTVPGSSAPVTTADVIDYWMTRPLNFAPGTRYDYSNLGYCMLGPVIEKISGQSYEHYLREQVLLPMDVHAMSIGKAGIGSRGPFEVKYYDSDGNALDTTGVAAAPLSTCAASGSWIGSAVDLVRVMTAIDGSRRPRYLSDATMTEYVANPQLPPFVPNEWWGLGIAIGPTPDAWSHGGLVPGAITVLQRTSQYTFAVITNSWPPDGNQFANDLHAAITEALRNGINGSATDLFAQFPSPSLPASTP